MKKRAKPERKVNPDGAAHEIQGPTKEVISDVVDELGIIALKLRGAVYAMGECRPIEAAPTREQIEKHGWFLWMLEDVLEDMAEELVEHSDALAASDSPRSLIRTPKGKAS